MKEISFITNKDSKGTRIDVFLANNTEFSRSFIKKITEKGFLKVNDKPVKQNYVLKDDDKIVLGIPEPEKISLEPQNIPLNIIYQDKDIAVIDKPAGLTCHPAPGNYEGTLVNALLYYIKDLSSIGGKIRPGIVHRLDKETSGVLVVAKNDNAHQNLSEQFKDHKIKKEYIALTWGRVGPDSGIIEKALGRSVKDRKKISVITTNAREAITEFFVEARFPQFTLLKIKLKTGRTHQIRVHLTSMGHPVVGDKTYGSAPLSQIKDTKLRAEIKRLDRHLLHAAKLGFDHPVKGEFIEFDSNLPEEFEKIVKLIA